jgi:hypothetical protein
VKKDDKHADDMKKAQEKLESKLSDVDDGVINEAEPVKPDAKKHTDDKPSHIEHVEEKIVENKHIEKHVDIKPSEA